MLCLRAAGPSRPPWRKAAHPCRIHLARSALGVGLCFVGFQRPGTFIIGKPDLSPPPPRQFTAVHTRPSCFAPMPICFHPHPICLPCYSALSLPSRVDAPLVFSLPWPASSRARARSQCLNGCNSQSVSQCPSKVPNSSGSLPPDPWKCLLCTMAGAPLAVHRGVLR